MWILIFIIAFTKFTACLDTSEYGYGFATPVMGWNPYNAHLSQNEETIKGHADIIADQGYLDVGYRYINL
ncbi:6944_t:CDS:2, partial [Cetraspora pellucida]